MKKLFNSFTELKPLPEPDISAAVFDFILTFARPELKPEAIYQGWENRSALPAAHNEYAVISILNYSRHGSNLETYKDGLLSLKCLSGCTVQIDLCSDSDLARQRAKNLEIIARSALGTEFFENLGLSCLYAENVKDISSVGDSMQYVKRFMLSLELSYWSGLSLEVPGFDSVQLERIENVDMHHKP